MVQDYRSPHRSIAPRAHLPTPDVNLIVNLDASLRVRDSSGDWTTVHGGDAFVAGLHTTVATTEVEGAERGIQVTLTPAGAHLLFGGIPLTELAERVVRVEDLFGAEAGDLIGRLTECPGSEERFGLLEDYLARRLDGAELAPELLRAWDGLAASHGTIRVAALARHVGWSEKRLVRELRRITGQRPKTVARLLRFRRVQALAATRASWAEIAIECGYHDQAHLTHEFVALAGESPTRFRARSRL